MKSTFFIFCFAASDVQNRDRGFEEYIMYRRDPPERQYCVRKWNRIKSITKAASLGVGIWDPFDTCPVRMSGALMREILRPERHIARFLLRGLFGQGRNKEGCNKGDRLPPSPPAHPAGRQRVPLHNAGTDLPNKWVRVVFGL